MLALTGLGRYTPRPMADTTLTQPKVGIVSLGETGAALTTLSAASPGQVSLRGEIWRARSRTHLPPGTAVRVRGIDGLTLDVEPLDPPPATEANHAV